MSQYEIYVKFITSSKLWKTKPNKLPIVGSICQNQSRNICFTPPQRKCPLKHALKTFSFLLFSVHHRFTPLRIGTNSILQSAKHMWVSRKITIYNVFPRWNLWEKKNHLRWFSSSKITIKVVLQLILQTQFYNQLNICGCRENLHIFFPVPFIHQFI
jgi:hypothetical protein